MSSKLQKSANKGVVFFGMKKMLLYWSVDQYNNLQKGKGCQGGRKGLNITANQITLRNKHRLFKNPLYTIKEK